MAKKETFNPHPFSTAFERAEEFLAGGKNGHNRPLQNNTYMARVDEDSIAIVLHSTAVVTYHRDRTFTIYGGGWNTVTTKDRISGWSPARPSSDGHDHWIIGYTGERTPPRVQKCRSCKGRGQWMEDDFCQGPYRRWYGPQDDNWCRGGGVEHRVPWVHTKDENGKTVSNWDEHYASRYDAPCEHGRMDSHFTKPCSHGDWGRHVTGRSERTCYRCDGEGRCDYGSKKIPILASAYASFLVDDTGIYLGPAEKPYAPGKYYTPPKPKPAPAPSPYHYGGEIVEQLARVLPNVKAEVMHPVTGGMNTLHGTIVSLNDGHRWSRERIADWLETLDLDLRFPTPEKGSAA